MNCQVSGCEKSAKYCKKIKGISYGIYREELILHHCGKHKAAEINSALETILNNDVTDLQAVNPFIEAQKIRKSS